MSKINVTIEDYLQSLIENAVSRALSKENKPTVVELPDNLTLSGATDFLKEQGFPTSKAKVYKLTSAEKIPHRKYGNKLVFSRKELLQWIESQTVRVSNEDSVLELARSARRKK